MVDYIILIFKSLYIVYYVRSIILNSEEMCSSYWIVCGLTDYSLSPGRCDFWIPTNEIMYDEGIFLLYGREGAKGLQFLHVYQLDSIFYCWLDQCCIWLLEELSKSRSLFFFWKTCHRCPMLGSKLRDLSRSKWITFWNRFNFWSYEARRNKTWY